MRFRRTFGVVAGALVAFAGMPLGAAPAQAASNLCKDASYARVGVYKIMYGGKHRGSIEVYYSSRTQKNCAVAVGVGDFYGRSNYKGVGIRVSGTTKGDNWAELDQAMYKYYAGPVFVKAPGKCIDVYGVMATVTRTVTHKHCG
ncbi:hypothetical protein [Nonomuraea sp. NPDC049695]|uniref:hypothetical protein n=1 Tax=Nonomuraea sp. NPDC049695 TaxID=3154734 RepID=UPI00344516AA